jgi:ABC-type Fe3+-hydroxamate transport system substrate-binding protein
MRPSTGLFSVAICGAVSLTALALTACGSQTATTSTQPSVPAPITLHDADNGKTVTAAVGQKVIIELGGPNIAGSTYWQFANVPAGVLNQVGDQVVSGPSQSAQPGVGIPNPPGMGMGTVVFTVQVASAGTGEVTAHRDSCGEAMMCSPDKSDFKVTIQATG